MIDALAAAATDLFSGEDPTRSMLPYVREARRELKVDPTFGAIPIGRGNESVEEVQIGVSGAREIGKIPCERFC